MTRITPLIICGGNGTRLWPVSRTQSPKQFQKVGDADSLTFFQSAVERHRGPGYEPPCIVSSVRHRATIAEQLAAIGCTDAHVIHEPMGRNTGPAVLAAALRLQAQDPGALMVVVPADHVIEGDLNSTILAMRDAAGAGRIITFGIKPRYAETGFGYITDAGPLIEHPGLRQVERFVEKPPTRKARLLVESDIAYWASGLSMFAAATIIAEYRKYDPATVAAVERAVAGGHEAPDGFELEAAHFGLAASAPTESTVFEKTDRIALAPLDVDWSDVGSWTAMYGISKSNPQGNVLQGDVIAVETTNSMVRSTSRLVTVVGLKDVIVIDTPDALLVTRVGHCQSVKKVAEYLKGGNRVEAERHQPILAPVPAPLPSGSGLTPLVQSDSLDMASARIAPGASLALDAVACREILVARGALIVASLRANTALAQGQRLDLEPHMPVVLVNTGEEEAELVVLTLRRPETAAETAAETGAAAGMGASPPLALYA
jgi:mannose-1-phosphate guanylyltransferase/mannose-6-phosphate isomerase